MNKAILGVLYVVATPIGNLNDMTFRAVEVLKNVDLIVAEDTRHCKVLLTHYEIKTPAVSLHEHNEREQAQKIIHEVQAGKNIALISDAGTPLISDPGYRLVYEARSAGIKVVPVPGPCAAIAALSVSGMTTDRFVFEGFLPAKSTARKSRLEQLKSDPRSMIFYEAPHRIVEVLEDMHIIFGAGRQAVLARELTKLFETVHGAPLEDLAAWVKGDANQQKGEMVLIVAGSPGDQKSCIDISAEKILDILLRELPLNQAVKLACEITGDKKNRLYKVALERK